MGHPNEFSKEILISVVWCRVQIRKVYASLGLQAMNRISIGREKSPRPSNHDHENVCTQAK